MICPKCQKENADGSKFCLNCGAQLVGSVVVEPSTKEVTVDQSLKSAKLLLKIAAIVSLVIGVPIGLFSLLCLLAALSTQRAEMWIYFIVYCMTSIVSIVFGILFLKWIKLSDEDLFSKKGSLVAFSVILILFNTFAGVPALVGSLQIKN